MQAFQGLLIVFHATPFVCVCTTVHMDLGLHACQFYGTGRFTEI